MLSGFLFTAGVVCVALALWDLVGYATILLIERLRPSQGTRLDEAVVECLETIPYDVACLAIGVFFLWLSRP